MSVKHREADDSVKEIDGQRFTTGPGLIQPLFLTAYKYRHPLHRRRAVRSSPLPAVKVNGLGHGKPVSPPELWSWKRNGIVILP